MRCFEKVSLDEFKKYYDESLYDFNLPSRSTKRSAGYDFFAPSDFIIKKGECIKIPTCVKASMEERDVLYLYIRSSYAIKYGLVLKNNVGVIDSDYYNNIDNDGHFYFQYFNFLDHDLEVKKGDIIGQVIFMKYLMTDDDKATGVRVGGFGSTDKK